MTPAALSARSLPRQRLHPLSPPLSKPTTTTTTTATQEHGLLSFLGGKAALLLAIDEGRALDLLVAHLDSVPPSDVVPG